MKTQLTPEQLEKRKSTNKKILLFGVLPILLIVIILAMIPGDANYEKQKLEDQKTVAEKPKEDDNTSAAYIMSQKYVKQRLNYPAEADFDFLPKLSEIQEGNLYRVVGGVTVKNAFGVKTEIQYLCRMKYLGGNALDVTSWELVDLSL